MGRYVISTVRPNRAGDPVYEIVTDRLQRMFITVPRRRSTAVDVAATIDHAIDALYAAPKPVS